MFSGNQIIQTTNTLPLIRTVSEQEVKKEVERKEVLYHERQQDEKGRKINATCKVVPSKMVARKVEGR